MRDRECVSFLQWALPQMGLRWPGFRKVRGQVCKRIARRMRDLGVEELERYREFLEDHAQEWAKLDSLCRITISRFFRDRGIYEALQEEVIPRLVELVPSPRTPALEVWSAGCGAGEEPYSISIVHRELLARGVSVPTIRITATDADEYQLGRAREGVYPASSLREISPELLRRAFESVGSDLFRLREPYRQGIEWRRQDVRQEMPAGPFHLILCRNLAFTYFDAVIQKAVFAALIERLEVGGYLVIGSHESLPLALAALEPHANCPCILGPRDFDDIPGRELVPAP